MGDIPQPRSYSQILGDAIDTFLSKLGLSRIKVGSPILSILETAAQSDVRSSQDIFSLLDSLSIDRATGLALANIGADEGVFKIPSTSATGFVTFLDTSFTKKTTNIYQGLAAPNIGTNILRVTDASSFPLSGSIYIGRGTNNYEGPITYTTSAPVGVPYWTLTLGSNTTKSHNLGEIVTLAQGGLRTIQSGTIVQTSQGNSSDSVKFSTLYSSQIEDGETSSSNVEVVAELPGTSGNVPYGAIKELSGTPYAGAAVTNLLPFTNGYSEESDDDYRERIKHVRQSRQKGTNLAITTGIRGVTSKEDNSTVISSSIVSANTPTVYIDDGTGYEESTDGVAQEILVESALGGEQYFQLSNRPITKAFVTTTMSAPFVLKVGDVLMVKVGDVLSQHTFDDDEFKSIGNATASEVVSAINGNSSLLFQARTANSGTKVSIFPKEDVEIEVVSDTANTANVALGFPVGIHYSLRLFKNDSLLYRDGKKAIVTGASQPSWGSSIANNDTLQVKVDGTATQTITVTDSDFTALGLNSVSSSNSLSSWATVLTSKLAGATVSASVDKLTIESNLDYNSRAKIEIVGGTLVTKGMFTLNDVSAGKNSDYTLNRNMSQLKLNSALAKGDNLVAATSYTRAYVQSESELSSSITFNSTANLYIAVDSAASIVSTGMGASTSVTITDDTNEGKYTATNGTFTSVKQGDWFIVWDPAFTDKGAFRVSEVDSSGAWFKVERSGAVTAETKSPTSLGFVFARLNGQVQSLSLSAATVSLTNIVDSLNTQLIGAEASIYRNNKIRISTNSYKDSGDIIVLTANVEAQKLALKLKSLKTNNPSHFPTIEAGNSEIGTPSFKWTTVATVPSANTMTLTAIPSIIKSDVGKYLTFRKTLDIAGGEKKYGTNTNAYSVVTGIDTSNAITLPTSSKLYPRLAAQRLYAASPYRLTGEDKLNVVLDGDNSNKNFSIPFYRNIKPSVNAYGTSAFGVLDADNSNLTLYPAFGASTTLFNDCALFMKARGKSYSTTANKTILWRSAKYGSQGNDYRISFINPTAPDQSVLSLTTDTTDAKSNIKLKLPSGAERTGTGITGTSHFVISSNTLFTGVPTRTSNVVTVAISKHNLEVGDQIYQTNAIGDFPEGPKKITAITTTNFSYNENGINDTAASRTYTLAKRPAGTSFTVNALASDGTAVTATTSINHNFEIGDGVYFHPGHMDIDATSKIDSGLKTITAKTANTISWTNGLIPAAGAITLVSGVDYSVSVGQCNKITVLNFKAPIPVGSLSRSGSTVTATIDGTMVATITEHPYNIGDVIYLSPGEAEFPSGAKIVTSKTATTFTYTENGTAPASSTSIQYFNSNNPDINFTSAGIIAGDIVNIDSNSNLDNNIEGSYRVFSVSSDKFSILKNEPSYAGNTVPKSLGNTGYMKFFPITAQTATQIKDWVNANISSIVGATLVPNNGGGSNDGTATVAIATEEEYNLTTTNASLNGSSNQSVKSWPLFDGVNYIQNTSITSVPASTISLKNAVSSELISNSDFLNENMRIVPLTLTNIENWLSKSAITTYAINGDASRSSDGTKLQLTSFTNGSDGSVYVSGGTASSSTATIIGSGSAVGASGLITVPTTQLAGFTGGSWVKLQGTGVSIKTTPFVSGTSVAIANSSTDKWKITLSGSGTTAVNEIQSITATGKIYQVEKQGNFMAFIDASAAPTTLSGSINEGDYVYISVAAMSANNKGIKQVVRVDSSSNTFWIEANGTEEIVTTASGDYIKFLTYDSVIPGDKLLIGTNILGSTNVGTFTVSDLVFTGSPATTLTANEFIVSGTMTAQGATALGNNYVFFQIQEGTPIKLFKQISSFIADSANTTNSFVLFNTNSYISKISSNTDAVMTAQDKFGFDTNQHVGLDAYKYNTGLLQEVNRVIYGDENNPTVYPGIIASNATLDISGPSIRRINVSLSVRIRTGLTAKDVTEKVRNAVASLISSTGVGSSIAISDIISVANSIDGVVSVAVTSPTYNSGNDLISVQANEKPMILDIENDILVSILT